MTKKNSSMSLQVTPEQRSQISGAFKFWNINDEDTKRLEKICVVKTRTMIAYLLDNELQYEARTGNAVKSATVSARIQEVVAELRNAYWGDGGKRRSCPLALILLAMQRELPSEDAGTPYRIIGGHGNVGRYFTGQSFQDSEYISKHQCVWDDNDVSTNADGRTVQGFIEFVKSRPDAELERMFAEGKEAPREAVKRIISSLKDPRGDNWKSFHYLRDMRNAMEVAHRMIHNMLKAYGVDDPSCADIAEVADAGRFSTMMKQHAATCDVRHYKTDEPERVTEGRLRTRLTELGLVVESGKIDRGPLSGMKPDLRVGNGSQWVQVQDIAGLFVEVKAKGKLELAPTEWIRLAQYRYETPKEDILVLYAPKGDSGESLLDSPDAPPAIEQIKKSKPDIKGKSCFNCFDEHEECIRFICGVLGVAYKEPAPYSSANTFQSVLYAEDDTDRRFEALERRCDSQDEKLDKIMRHLGVGA